MFRRLSIFIVALLFHASVWGQTVVYVAQVGDGRIADIQFQTTLIFVNTGGDVTITLEFFTTGTGAPLTLTLGDLGTDDTFQIPLRQGESFSAQTPGTGGIQVGYARVTIPEGGMVGGTAVFTRTDIPTGTILYEAGVPASDTLHDFTIFVDTIGNRDTGLAMVNADIGGGGSPAGGSNVVNLRLYDQQFNQIATTDVPLNPGQHSARFIPQIFDAVPQAAEMLGSVAVSSPDDLTAVTLRTNDEFGVNFPDEVETLTAFPVVEGSAQAPAGLFSVLATGSAAVTLDLSEVEETVTGLVFYAFGGDQLLAEKVRGLGPGEGPVISEVLRLARGGRTVDRVEVELIYSGGGRSPRITLEH